MFVFNARCVCVCVVCCCYLFALFVCLFFILFMASCDGILVMGFS